jgi:hypothetical protein
MIEIRVALELPDLRAREVRSSTDNIKIILNPTGSR